MLVCLMLIISAFDSAFLQDNIFEFSPNQPLCLGEEVNLTCYLFPNTQTYNVFALISFNQTDPETVNNINTNRASIGYSATVAIPLMGSSARVQLTIASFKESDNNTLFGCHAELTSDASVTTVIESGYPPIAAPPSTPPVVTVDSTNGTHRVISWTAPASDRPIDRYYLYRNSSLLTVTTDTQYTDTTGLEVDKNHTYSVEANSCAGNSDEGSVNYSITAYGLDSNAPISISYSNITNTVDVNWTLNTNPEGIPLIITYNLTLAYSYTQADNLLKYNNTNISFPLSSDAATYTTEMIRPPIYSTNATVVFNITACINITEQNGVSFPGERVCGSNSTEFNPIVTPTTTATQATSQSVANTTTAVASSPGSVTPVSGPIISAAIIGAVVAVAILCGCCALVTVIIILIICLKQKGQGSSKRNNLMTEEGDTKESGGINKQNIEMERSTPQKPELLYAELDLVASRTGEVSQTVEETHYTAVRPLMDGPRK